jgi:hypothetical protein
MVMLSDCFVQADELEESFLFRQDGTRMICETMPSCDFTAQLQWTGQQPFDPTPRTGRLAYNSSV